MDTILLPRNTLEMGKWVFLKFSVYPIMFLIRYIECDEHANEKRKISNTYLVICINTDAQSNSERMYRKNKYKGHDLQIQIYIRSVSGASVGLGTGTGAGVGVIGGTSALDAVLASAVSALMSPVAP